MERPATATTEPSLFELGSDSDSASSDGAAYHTNPLTDERRDALRSLGAQLLELREMLKTSQTEEASEHLRNL